MRISVVIPAYNASPYIAETLESVLNQTLPPDEVLVIDDGSTDNTAEVAERFVPRIKLFRRPNCRQSITRNFGVEQAQGEWIAFVDADDLWERNKLERQMEQLALRPQADLCYTGTVFLMQKGDKAELGKVLPTMPEEKVREALLEHVTFMPSSVVVRRSVFLKTGGFDPQLKRGTEDHDMWLRLREMNVVFTACPEPLVQYRRHPTNTVTSIPWFEECMDLYRRRVMPQIPWTTRWIRYYAYRSDREADTAYTLRVEGNPRCITFMAASILHRPFHEPYRMKALTLMIYVRLRQILGLPPRKA